MEQLKTAIKLAGGPAAMAAVIGVSQSAPHMWLARGKVPPEHCAAIEQATAGAVTRRDLRPDDWHRIWPELVTAEFPAPSPAEPAKPATVEG